MQQHAPRRQRLRLLLHLYFDHGTDTVLGHTHLKRKRVSFTRPNYKSRATGAVKDFPTATPPFPAISRTPAPPLAGSAPVRYNRAAPSVVDGCVENPLMKMHRLVPIALTTLLAASAAVHAQNTTDALTAARAKTDLTDEDRGLIRTFVTDRVTELLSKDATNSRAAGAALRSAYTGSEPFKQAYIAACNDVFGSAVKKADVEPAARLVTLLAGFGALETQPVLLEALQDERVGVRAAGAIGLRSLRAKIAPAAGNYSNVVSALREAGKKERSRDTLRAIYGALAYAELPSPPDLKPAQTALLDLLESRAKLYAARGDVPGVGADDAGLMLAEKHIKSLSDDEKKRLTTATAAMVRFAIEEYRSPVKKLYEVTDKASNRPQVEYRDAVERLVLVGERLLGTLLGPKPAPAVMDAMRKRDRAGMKLEWEKWGALLRTAVNDEFTLQETPEPEAPADPNAADSPKKP